jgi:hypothetical protein
LLRRRPASGSGAVDDPSADFQRPDLAAPAQSGWSTATGSAGGPGDGGSDLVGDEDLAVGAGGLELDEPDAVGLGDDVIVVDELGADEFTADRLDLDETEDSFTGGTDDETEDSFTGGTEFNGGTEGSAPDETDETDETDEAPAYWSKPTPGEGDATTDDPDQTGEISATPLRAWTPQTPGSSDSSESSESSESAASAPADSETDGEGSGKRKRWWNRA